MPRLLPFNLDKTLDCGQVFRWSYSGDRWTGVVDGKVIHIHQKGSKIFYDGIEPDDLVRYLNLDLDPTDVIYSIRNSINLDTGGVPDPFFEAAVSDAKARELDPLIDEPFRKKVGALADLMVTPLPTVRPPKTEDKLNEMIKSDVDIGKKPDPTGPDMVMYDLQASISQETRQVAITAVIGNEGIKPSRDFFITFFGSYSTPVTSDDTAIGFYLVPNLLPGMKKTITGYFPVSQIPSGAYYIGAYMDPNNEVMEISEDNNGKTAPTLIDVPEVASSEGSQLGSSQLAVPMTPVEEPLSNKRPDLIIDTITGQTEAILGDTIPVTTTVRNTGDADAGQFRLTVYLSRDTAVTSDDISLGYGEVPDLVSGKAREGVASVTIPLNVLPGLYYLLAMADSQGKILEKNKENNSRGGGYLGHRERGNLSRYSFMRLCLV